MLKTEFFARPTLTVARELLGKRLIRRLEDKNRLGGTIVEVEAYIGESDKACHASRGRTPKTEGLYDGPGHLYIYQIYGKYWCLNIVTEAKGFPAAVLIRAIEPKEGIDCMMQHRPHQTLRNLTNGPGKLCQALAITGAFHRRHIDDGVIMVEDEAVVPDDEVVATPRIGVHYAGEDAKLPWRFYLKGSPYVS